MHNSKHDATNATNATHKQLVPCSQIDTYAIWYVCSVPFWRVCPHNGEHTMKNTIKPLSNSELTYVPLDVLGVVSRFNNNSLILRTPQQHALAHALYFNAVSVYKRMMNAELFVDAENSFSFTYLQVLYSVMCQKHTELKDAINDYNEKLNELTNSEVDDNSLFLPCEVDNNGVNEYFVYNKYVDVDVDVSVDTSDIDNAIDDMKTAKENYENVVSDYVDATEVIRDVITMARLSIAVMQYVEQNAMRLLDAILNERTSIDDVVNVDNVLYNTVNQTTVNGMLWQHASLYAVEKLDKFCTEHNTNVAMFSNSDYYNEYVCISDTPFDVNDTITYNEHHNEHNNNNNQ